MAKFIAARGDDGDGDSSSFCARALKHESPVNDVEAFFADKRKFIAARGDDGDGDSSSLCARALRHESPVYHVEAFFEDKLKLYIVFYVV
ncbi:hypothetical protein TKK_0016690 [Trichogramma kaykai]|uniref:Uncharacterized protein n=1 Tax=Trichogramma kaykai TaxID=54128 RepID=A0ABD2W688_9HYME